MGSEGGIRDRGCFNGQSSFFLSFTQVHTFLGHMLLVRHVLVALSSVSRRLCTIDVDHLYQVFSFFLFVVVLRGLFCQTLVCRLLNLYTRMCRGCEGTFKETVLTIESCAWVQARHGS